ncbi:MAG: hypothetical protein HZB53_05275 [Chloroflexi bacterium]|nr:hypothetical protein [Chloroflexota bacterium]
MLKRLIWLLALLSIAGCGFSGQDSPETRAPTPDPRLLYPIPGACPQTNSLPPSALPDERMQLTNAWIGKDNILAGLTDSIAWHKGENSVTWYSIDGQPEVTSSMVESEKTRIATVAFLAPRPPYYPSTLTIPLGGCWAVSAVTPKHKLIFTVFAYPDRVAR